jgi:anthraniloyl-CoA monooxygenase
MYQVPFADLLRNRVGIPTMAVGNLTSGDACNTILAAGRADLCVLARQHLRDPHFSQHEAARYHFADLPYPPPYRAIAPSASPLRPADRDRA